MSMRGKRRILRPLAREEPTVEVIQRLRKQIGLPILTAGLGVSGTDVVLGWVLGSSAPTQVQITKLRLLDDVVGRIVRVHGRGSANAWLLKVDDSYFWGRSPLEVIAEDVSGEARVKIMAAVREFTGQV